uniref:Uncharacterized protein n=1 Tax=Lepeophtheirus salmonis TaxID=72036 RepID=A0A0K2UNV7_LEPSM
MFLDPFKRSFSLNNLFSFVAVIISCFFILALDFARKSSLNIFWSLTFLTFVFLVILKIVHTGLIASLYLTNISFVLTVRFRTIPFFLFTVPYVSNRF